jgi:hypothetical protein
MDTEEQRDETDVAEETPEEFAEELENDPARNPDDEDAKRIQGG